LENRDHTSLSVRLRHHVAVLQHRLDQAAAALAAVVTPTAIHRTRVAARRLRVFLHGYRKEFDPQGVKRYRRELKKLTRDLEAAREGDVTRRAMAQLTRNRKGNISGDSRALYERAVKRYESALYSLRLTIASAPWQQRLTDLRQLSARSSLVKENEDFAVKAMYRLVKRRRQRLRDSMARVSRSPKKLHRIRLKVKAMRYLLEGYLPENAIARNVEIKRLRQIQNCLGDMHDEEILLKSLRAEQWHGEAARGIYEKLKARKSRHLHAYREHRKALMRAIAAHHRT
jgi:CHAD domain-containing protein